MILNCPSCNTRYHIDPASLGDSGRVVRCAKCGYSWHHEPPADMPKRVDMLPPLGGAERTTAPLGMTPLASSRRRRANRLGWLILAAVVIIVVAGGILARGTITDAWPPAEKLYSAVGLGAEEPIEMGLDIRNVSRQIVEEGGVPILVIRGEVWNVSQNHRRVPAIRVGLIDDGEQELHHWTFAAEHSELDAGAATEFETRLTSPPVGATSFVVSFAGERRG